MKVLNFGSLNIDYVYKVSHVVERGETISSRALHTYPGGKGLNQSIALGKAGAEVYHAGSIGQEGRFLEEFLKEAGVNTDYVRILSEVKSGHAIIQNDDNGDNCILLYGGANQEITREQADETLSSFEEGDYLILQNEINELPYIVEKAHEKGMKIVLNPSPTDEKIQSLALDKIDYFILNEIEAGQILRTECDGGQGLADALAEKFPKAKIILTLGGEGSVYFDGTKRYVQKIYEVETVDTTAAGDTFTGYFIAGIIQELPVEEAMDMAAKAAAITVSRAGAGVAIPTMEEVKKFR